MTRTLRFLALTTTGALMAFAVTLAIASADSFDPVSVLGPL